MLLMRLNMSIRSQIQSLLLGALIFGILCTAGLVTYFFSSDLRGLTRRTTFDASYHLASRLQTELKTSVELARLVAAASFQDFRYEEDRDRFLREALRSRPQIFALTLVERNSASERDRLPNGKPWKIRWRIGNQSLSDREVSALDPRLLSLPEEFQEIHAYRGNSAGGVGLFRWVLPMVQSPQGRVTHLISLDLKIEPWIELFSSYGDAKHLLMDAAGQILLQSADAPILSSETLGKVGDTGLRDFVDVQQGVHLGAYHRIVLQLGGHEVRSGVQPAAPPAQLRLLTLIPDASVSSKILRVVRRATWVAGLFLVISAMLGGAIARALSQPLRRLADAAKKVREGDFSVRTIATNTLHPPSLETHNEMDQLAVVFDQMVLGLQERDRLKVTFSKFHGLGVAEKILRGEMHLGGERREGIVFFSDIRGFTKLSEELPPETMVHLLNRYFSRMVHIIHSHGGIVDKYIGDAILAVWGVPDTRPDDALFAVRACIDMSRALAQLNRELGDEHLPTLRVGMGLNAGPLLAGNIGSEERMEYTVIGDTVNTANRIESMTKELGADVLVSESVFQKLGVHAQEFDITPVESAVTVKGKQQALRLYKINVPT